MKHYFVFLLFTTAALWLCQSEEIVTETEEHGPEGAGVLDKHNVNDDAIMANHQKVIVENKVDTKKEDLEFETVKPISKEDTKIHGETDLESQKNIVSQQDESDKNIKVTEKEPSDEKSRSIPRNGNDELSNKQHQSGDHKQPHGQHNMMQKQQQHQELQQHHQKKGPETTQQKSQRERDSEVHEGDTMGGSNVEAEDAEEVVVTVQLDGEVGKDVQDAEVEDKSPDEHQDVSAQGEVRNEMLADHTTEEQVDSEENRLDKGLTEDSSVHVAANDEVVEPGSADVVEVTQGDERPSSDLEAPQVRPLEASEPHTAHGDDLEIKPQEDMPSFDEWKQKMLAEQQKEQQEQNAQANLISNGSTLKPKTNKNWVNYAAAPCGAKILGTNNEAINPAFLLTENKDQYMINPCKVKKWFTVELCEPVQVHNLEMGNLELFSSLPDSFVVFSSERYPTKEWNTLGTFHARDERSIQSFSVQDDQMFVKYLKVEMQTHYGTEHYCPLSILRVYGVTMEDEDAEDADGEDHNEQQQEKVNGEPSNLFASATDTVLSLVKHVLSPGEKDPQVDLTEEELAALDPQNTTNNNTKQGNTETADTQPCPPDANVNGEIEDIEHVDPPNQPETPNVFENKKIIENQAEEDNNMDNEPIVRLIEKPIIKMTSLLQACQFCSKSKIDTCYFDRYSFCGYYRIFRFVRPTCCVGEAPPVKIDGNLPVVTPPDLHLTEPEENSHTTMMTDEVHSPEYIQHASTGALRLDSSTSPLTTESVDPTPAISEASRPETITESPTSIPNAPSDNVSVLSEVSSTANSEATEAAASEENIKVSVDTKQCDEGSNCQVGPDVMQMQVKPTETLSEHVTVTPDEQEPIDDLEDVDDLGADDLLDEIVEDTGTGGKDIYAEEPSAVIRDLELEGLPPPSGDEIQYQKLNSGKKETTYMRLKNKIKALELNLNLSSRYLDELSQRYRRQMEEMGSSLNKTILRITNASRKADEKDDKRHQQILSLQHQVDNLTTIISSMQDHIDTAHLQLIERHLALMAGEVLVFLLVLAWCARSRGGADRPRPLPPKPPIPTRISRSEPPPQLSPPTKPHTHRRHNSIDSPSRWRSGTESLIHSRLGRDDVLRKSGSENDITIIEPNIPLFQPHFDQHSIQRDVSKKKKKKKARLPQNSLPSLMNHKDGSQKVKKCVSLPGTSSSHGHHSTAAKTTRHDKSTIHNGADNAEGGSHGSHGSEASSGHSVPSSHSCDLSQVYRRRQQQPPPDGARRNLLQVYKTLNSTLPSTVINGAAPVEKTSKQDNARLTCSKVENLGTITNGMYPSKGKMRKSASTGLIKSENTVLMNGKGVDNDKSHYKGLYKWLWRKDESSDTY